MVDKLRQYYLQTMGIDIWIKRQRSHIPKNRELDLLAEKVSLCKQCELHKTRAQTVFSRGNSGAKLMIIGEAPGFYEDKQGLPFVGKAGVLLNKMLKGIGLSEEDVYIANVLKCRPPNNRDPHQVEINQCSPYLAEQIELINPWLILALGRFSGQFLLKKAVALKQLRHSFHYYNDIPFIVSYHPAYLLRNPADKKKAFLDLLMAKQFLAEKNSSLVKNQKSNIN